MIRWISTVITVYLISIGSVLAQDEMRRYHDVLENLDKWSAW